MNRRAAAIGKSDDQPAWKVRNNVGNRGIGNTRFFREGDTARDLLVEVGDRFDPSQRTFFARRTGCIARGSTDALRLSPHLVCHSSTSARDYAVNLQICRRVGLLEGAMPQWRPNSAAQLNDAMGQNWTCLKPRAASRFWQTLRPGTSHDHGWQPRSWERSLQISDCDDTAGQVWGLPLRCHALFLGSACSQTADDAGTQSVEAR
jgi:hypothetical protein